MLLLPLIFELMGLFIRLENKTLGNTDFLSFNSIL